MTTSPGNALDGKHVLVTGGSSGIGKACAERYRAEGATVYVTDIRPSSSDEIELDVEGGLPYWKAETRSPAGAKLEKRIRADQPL